MTNTKFHKGPSRIETLTGLVSKHSSLVYDLFCDHGKVGVMLSKLGYKVILNDRSEHVYKSLSSLVNESSNLEYIHSNAQEILPKKGSTLIMAGVGGYCIIECLKSWLDKLDEEHWASLTFITCAHYHSLELREYLNSINMGVDQTLIIEESSQYYEVLKLGQKLPQKLVLFDSDFWENCPAKSLEFIRRIAKNLRLKRDISPSEIVVLEQINTILKATN